MPGFGRFGRLVLADLRSLGDTPRANSTGRSLQGMREINPGLFVKDRRELCEDRTGLDAEQREHFAFQRAVSQGLAGEMHEVKRALKRGSAGFTHMGESGGRGSQGCISRSVAWAGSSQIGPDGQCDHSRPGALKRAQWPPKTLRHGEQAHATLGGCVNDDSNSLTISVPLRAPAP